MDDQTTRQQPTPTDDEGQQQPKPKPKPKPKPSWRFGTASETNERLDDGRRSCLILTIP